MVLSAFADRSHEPTDRELGEVLAGSYTAWTHLIDAVTQRIGPLSLIWGYTSKTTGWGLRLRHNDRVILYMTPQSGQFLVSFVLGKKAVVAAHQLKLPTVLLQAIDEAPRYAEGRGLRLVVSNERQVASLAKLAKIKIDN